ncbi:hypothetical protein B9T19_04975 [Ignatzschineria sp. F8392]|uniref:glycosyltransferase n=1 Tax=Ignatzschineria sp. F8392 TaxID=1980117 RepID=UPI000BD489ED|nr:glycosyltransferase [Ignatzschineria sp. F8392]OYQ80597.1 hypothetical protein B9T19_04975 [Ignatzschineria sp. F8392]
MKLLVLSETYPHINSIYQMAYVHSRNIQYKKQGVKIDVLSFSAKSAYKYENITVLPSTTYIDFSNYDAVVSHAPNIRNHYRIIRKNLKKIKNLVLFFHGHEALIIDRYYPAPYPWQKQKNAFFSLARKFYDHFKLYLLKNLLKKGNVRAIYVSQWMKDEATHCMKLSDKINNKNIIINNSINEAFYKERYSPTLNLLADFITIRPLDGPKYAIDKVVELAHFNPEFSFHIYGKGDYFQHNTLPPNVKIFDQFIEQKSIPVLLNKYRAAIMPTRLDAQGVMMCEMASYGIPTIVSNLPVCREMLSEFSNCIFIDNSNFCDTDLNKLSFTPLIDFSVIQKFSPDYLAKKELDFIFKK